MSEIGVPKEQRAEEQSAKENHETPIQPHLSIWDTVSVIVGIVIGAGIYETAPLIFSTVSSPGMAIGVWAFGGFLSLVGALCYSELAATYPKSGGDYVYLTNAYGSGIGFLFGWAQLSVILTGSIGMMAYIFADYATVFLGLNPSATFLLAVGSVVILSVVNILGVVAGKRTQNFFTAAKILGLFLIVLAGLMAMPDDFSLRSALLYSTSQGEVAGDWSAQLSSLGLAMVFVLYTYGGWNDAAFVASEMKDSRRSIPITLVLGTVAITLIYLLVNVAYLMGLGFERAGNSKAIASELLQWPLGSAGSSVMSLLVMVSALGAVNGLIYTGSRLYSAVGSEHRFFAWLSQWHPRLKSPVASLSIQALVSVALIVIVGSSTGRNMVGGMLSALSLPEPVWEGHGGFDTLLRCTAPVFWIFFLLSGVALFVLRYKDSGTERPFRVPFYPYTPLLFCITSLYMLYRSVIYAGSLTVVGIVLLCAGIPFYIATKRESIRQSMTKKQKLISEVQYEN